MLKRQKQHQKNTHYWSSEVQASMHSQCGHQGWIGHAGQLVVLKNEENLF